MAWPVTLSLIAASRLVRATPLTPRDVTTPFPDGQLACSTFPSSYGAVAESWFGLGGWTGIQQTTITNGNVGPVLNVLSGSTCSPPNDYCSYACPQGYLKTQWPVQTSGGATVGGLLCDQTGKLRITNPNFTTLCTSGAGSILVQNALGSQVCFCGTDYPGEETPADANCVVAGGTGALAITQQSTYFKYQGRAASAQYFVNPAGTASSNACIFGSDQTANGVATGNWAPLSVGASQDSNGNTFIALISNEENRPQKVVPLNFNIALSGDFGGASCSYKVVNGQGQFCSGSTCQLQGQSLGGGAPVPGCTVQLLSGKATIKLTSS